MARLKTIAFHVLPLIAGAVVITAFGVGLTKYKNSPLDYRYSLLEMEPLPIRPPARGGYAAWAFGGS